MTGYAPPRRGPDPRAAVLRVLADAIDAGEASTPTFTTEEQRDPQRVLVHIGTIYIRTGTAARAVYDTAFPRMEPPPPPDAEACARWRALLGADVLR